MPRLRSVRSPVAPNGIGGDLDDRDRTGRSQAVGDRCRGRRGRQAAGRDDGPGWQRRAARLGRRRSTGSGCGRSRIAGSSPAGSSGSCSAVGEDLVRVPPKLTVPERRAGRTRGKSDPIDALAIARAALREPDLSRPRPDEQRYREIKLLVDHRDDLVDQRRRTQQRLRWHLFQLDPTYVVPLRMLGRSSHLERVSRWLARQDQELQVRLARELVSTLPLAQPRDRRARPGARTAGQGNRAGAARAARLRRGHRREAARRDRPDRPLQKRRPTRPPQRRRTPRSKLRPHPTPPPRPRRQPPTQRRALPNRDHPVPLPPRRPRLPRTQTSRRQKPPRSHPLPQTTPRPRRLQHPESEPGLDIGATLAQPKAQALVTLCY